MSPKQQYKYQRQKQQQNNINNSKNNIDDDNKKNTKQNNLKNVCLKKTIGSKINFVNKNYGQQKKNFGGKFFWLN